MKALEGYEIIEFGGIEANPDFDTLVKAVDQIHKLDMSRVFLLAVGGGSVADGTKFIGAACQYTKSEGLWELVLSSGFSSGSCSSYGLCDDSSRSNRSFNPFPTSRQVLKVIGVLLSQDELLTYTFPYPNIIRSANNRFTALFSSRNGRFWTLTPPCRFLCARRSTESSTRSSMCASNTSPPAHILLSLLSLLSLRRQCLGPLRRSPSSRLNGERTLFLSPFFRVDK